jgi:hypothetical protein
MTNLKINLDTQISNDDGIDLLCVWFDIDLQVDNSFMRYSVRVEREEVANLIESLERDVKKIREQLK